jgi:excinuclease UvrABC nuclease subunit
MEIPSGFYDGTALIRPGVYILAWRGEVVYVGQSKCLATRVYNHVVARGKRQQRLSGRVVKGVVFDQIWFRPCQLSDLDNLEKELIQKYLPRYNERHKPIPVIPLDVLLCQPPPFCLPPAPEPRVLSRRRL